ncbi:MAG: DUF350 domain-containing protein [Candidatus Thermoplasmatota archaeon]
MLYPLLAQAAEPVKPALNSALLGLAISLVQVLVSLGFAMLAVYAGIRIFDKFTKGIDEMAELKRGNTAVGVILAAVILSYATVISGGVGSLTNVVLNIGNQSVTATIVSFLGGLINLLIGLGLASAAIYIALSIFGKVTKGMDEQQEIAKGNLAVAFLLAGILLAVSTVIGAGVASVGAAIGTLGNALF